MIYKDFQDLKLSALGHGRHAPARRRRGRRAGSTRPRRKKWWITRWHSGESTTTTPPGATTAGSPSSSWGRLLCRLPAGPLFPRGQVPRLRPLQYGQGGGDLRGAAEKVPGGLLRFLPLPQRLRDEYRRLSGPAVRHLRLSDEAEGSRAHPPPGLLRPWQLRGDRAVPGGLRRARWSSARSSSTTSTGPSRTRRRRSSCSTDAASPSG